MFETLKTLPVWDQAKAIRLLILDVDGVLTDGKLFFDEQGTEYKAFHARDGHGIKLLQQTGVKVAVISGRKSQSVAIRMQNLGITWVYQGYEQKLSAFNEILEQLQLTPAEVAAVGDDLLDLPMLSRAGVAIAVADAHPIVRQHAHWTTTQLGGIGAVREVCDLLMQAQGSFDKIVADYLSC